MLHILGTILNILVKFQAVLETQNNSTWGDWGGIKEGLKEL